MLYMNWSKIVDPQKSDPYLSEIDDSYETGNLLKSCPFLLEKWMYFEKQDSFSFLKHTFIPTFKKEQVTTVYLGS